MRWLSVWWEYPDTFFMLVNLTFPCNFYDNHLYWNEQRGSDSFWVNKRCINCPYSVTRIKGRLKRLLQSWSLPWETALKREKEEMRVLLALCWGMIGGMGKAFILEGVGYGVRYVWMASNLWQPLPPFSNQWVSTLARQVSEEECLFPWAENIPRTLSEGNVHSFLWFQWAWSSYLKESF